MGVNRVLAAAVLVGAATLLASSAQAGDPPPRTVNGFVNPPVGAVVGRYTVEPDGTCDLGADGITLTGDTAVAVEVGADCAARVVSAADPDLAPEGRTVVAGP